MKNYLSKNYLSKKYLSRRYLERGMAYVTVAAIIVISAIIITSVYYFVFKGTQVSGLQKKYQTAKEASFGALDVMTKEIISSFIRTPPILYLYLSLIWCPIKLYTNIIYNNMHLIPWYID